MPAPEQIKHALENVNDQRMFVQNLLIDTLNWQIPRETESIDGISFGWTPDELGAADLDEHLVNGSIYQIQPMREDQPWGIFLLEFANEDIFTTGRGLTGPLRKVLRGLVPKRRSHGNRAAWNRENLLFICTHNYRYFRFAYFRAPLEKGHAEPLTMFGWSPDTPARTACEFNLPHLVWPENPEDSVLWVNEWSKAFDVETVTKKFYDDYEEVFENLQQALDFKEPDDKKMFAQVLMNRLMFLRFVERKGWLKFGNTNPKEYLKNLYRAGRIKKLSWYRSRLQVLFFEGLATPNHNREQIIGQVPYLNGGLFTISEWDERCGDIADEVFEPILGEEGLLYRYNFTVEESTPLDIEVAVDPEMLGKVFEKLVIARRESGSYYTPRTVVQFMCRESLKGYLGSRYSKLVDEHETAEISVPEARELLQKLDEVKVVDPACGSGAYLLGMLQELFSLSEKLDTRAQTYNPHDAYQRKLSIIHNNIYGVDLDEFAVGIARLRLWLSLAVDFQGNEPDPLPNLDYKIEIGDSLTASDPSASGQLDFFRQERIRQFDALKAEFMDPRKRSRHAGIENQIKQLREEIASFTHPRQKITGFDWRVEFAEVWSRKNGFDIVIANPPYGIAVDDAVRNMYFNQRLASEKGQSKDSYGIFIARGLQLLRPEGIMSYIVSDTWRTIKSHRPLRKRLLDSTSVLHVIDLPSWIFDATVNTCILTLIKQPSSHEHKLIAGDLRALEKDNWKALSDNLVAISEHGIDIQTLTYARYTYPQTLILTYANFSFFICSPTLYSLMNKPCFTKLEDVADVKVGLQTGDNGYYLRKRDARGSYEILNESKLLTDAEIINLSEDEKQNGINPRRHGGRHFVPYDKGGASDTDEGWLPNYYVPTGYFIDWSTAAVTRLKTYAPNSGSMIGRAVIRNLSYYFRLGITFSDVGFYSPTIRLSGIGVFDVKGSRMVIKNLHDLSTMALLGILCSRLIRLLIKGISNHTVSTQVDDFCEMPLPLANNQSRLSQIATLVSQIIEQQKSNLRYAYHLHEQKEIDALVYQLYGLNEEDIREVELWYCRRYPKLAEAQGLLAEVKEKYATHFERCKRILEKSPSYWQSNQILQLISQGENHTLEFKETLFVNIHTGNADDGVFHSSLKTIAGYLNTNGGTLLIGVNDSGEIKGIDRDIRASGRGRNRDSFELKLRDVLSGDNSRFVPYALGHCQISYEDLAEGTICRVDVTPVPKAEIAHLDDCVFVRDGNRTIQLIGPELTRWIQQRRS